MLIGCGRSPQRLPTPAAQPEPSVTVSSTLAPTPTALPPTETPAPRLTPFRSPTPYLLNAITHRTILLLGIDRGGLLPEADAVWIADLSAGNADPKNGTAGLIALPPGLFVVPALDSAPGYHRLSTIYGLAELIEPGTGAGITAKTLEMNLGIEIDGAVAMDFAAFAAAIDAIGGISVHIPARFVDSDFPGGALIMEAGIHELGGESALNYARALPPARLDAKEERAARQYAVMLAVRDRLLESGPEAWQGLAGWIRENNVQTDLAPADLIALGRAALEIPFGRLEYGTLSGEYVREICLDARGLTVPTSEGCQRVPVADLAALPALFGRVFRLEVRE